MASPAGAKPLSRQERRNRDRQRAQDQARKPKAGPTEDRQRRRVRDAAFQQDDGGASAASSAARPGPRMDTRTLIDGIPSYLDDPTTVALAEQLGMLGLTPDTAVGSLLHTLEAERDLIAAANDSSRHAVMMLPDYFALFTKLRRRCVEMPGPSGKGSKDGNGSGSGEGKEMDKRMPPVLLTKDPHLLIGLKHCHLNIEATMDFWTVLLGRVEESLHHWQSQSPLGLVNVAEDEVEMKIRMDLGSARTRVLYSIQHMGGALMEATEMIESLERGQGKDKAESAVSQMRRPSPERGLAEQGREAKKGPGEGVRRGRK